MPHHLLDLPFLLQIIQGLPSQTPIDLETIDEGGDGDETVGLHVFVEFVGGGFVEDDGVVGFVFDCWEGEEGVELVLFYMLGCGWRRDWRGYLCLWTTSSFASCRQMLLLGPGERVSDAMLIVF